MAIMNPGLIHAPVTPFAANGAVDYDAYARLLRFHLAHGADSIALPLHVGESVSLQHEERQRLLDTALAVAAVLSVVDTSSEISSQPLAGITVLGVLLSARSRMPVSTRGPCHGNSSAS